MERSDPPDVPILMHRPRSRGNRSPAMTPLWNDPTEETNNPRRSTERAAVREELAGRLAERGVELTGDESDEQVVRLLDAVEDFERARAMLGGDSMVNEPQSSS